MISLQHLYAGYGEKRALHDISLRVRQSDFIALLGPNGSGKSTLLKIMSGQMPPVAGEIRLDNRELAELSPRQRSQRIAYFPQSRPTPNMDVHTLVSHGRFPRLGFGHVMGPADHRAVDEAMAKTGLTALAGRALPSLSGGERQRAYLAMLIAQEAEILLLDEPSSFLDIRHQLEVMNILRELNSEGKAIVLACHDLPLAFSYAGRIVLLSDGILSADASPESMADSQALKRTFGVGLKRQEGGLLHYGLVGADDGTAR